MYPHLFSIGRFTVTSFGLMMFLAFVVGAWVLARQFRARGIEGDTAWDMLLWIALGGILGAKLYYLLLHLDDFAAAPLRELTARGGLVWYGGLMGGIAAFAWQIRRRRLPTAHAFDAVAPALALSYAIGRIGCFLVGDDYGRPTDAWVGVAFPDGYPPSTAGYFRSIGQHIPAEIPDTAVLAVHPTQLYEVGLALAIFAILWRLSGRLRPGRLFATYLALYGVERFGIEFLRAKTDYVLPGLTTSQLASVALLVIAAVLWRRTGAGRAIEDAERAAPHGAPGSPGSSGSPGSVEATDPVGPGGSPTTGPIAHRSLAVLLALGATGAVGALSLGPGRAAAQDPTERATQRPTARAAVWTEPAVPRVAFAIGIGTLGISDLQVQPVRAERTGPGGTVTESVLRRSIRAEGGYQVSGSALLSLSRAWAVRAGAGAGRADLRMGYGGDDDDLLAEARGIPLPGEATLNLVSGEAALRFRVPAPGRFRPYGELGVAAERWGLDGGEDALVPGTEPLLEEVTRIGAHIAVGGEFPLTGRLDGRLQLSTRLFRTPVTPGPAGTALGGTDSLRLTLAAIGAAPFADGAVEIARIFRLEAGLSLRLGAVGEPPKPSAGSGDAPSDSPR